MRKRFLKYLSATLFLFILTGCASDSLEKMISADATGVISLDVPAVLKTAGMLDDGNVVLPESLRQAIDDNDTSPLCILLNDLPQLGIDTDSKAYAFSRSRPLGACCSPSLRSPTKPARHWQCVWAVTSTRSRV